MAVRDADPKRLAARDRADAEAEKRMARQEARATAEAEAALLVARGYAAPEGCFAQKKKTAGARGGAPQAPRPARRAENDKERGKRRICPRWLTRPQRLYSFHIARVAPKCIYERHAIISF